MDSEYLQHVRYKLQKRLKRLNTAEFQEFHEVLIQVWAYLNTSPLTSSLLDDLQARFPGVEADADNLFKGQGRDIATEAENTAFCYWVIKKCTIATNNGVEIQIGRKLDRTASNHNDAIEVFRRVLLEPLFDYLDEEIDDKRIALALLRKFKHKVEWFDRERLRANYVSNTGRGEKNLALELYAYLHDQGIEFSIEPSSASGEADLVSAQRGEQRLVADVKVFDPEGGKDKRHLRSGFAQVYQYTKDFNELFGFLVVFKLCKEDLAVTSSELASGWPVFRHNNKTLFVLVIDIFDYAQSASKRGPLKSYELTSSELIESLENDPPKAPSAS